MKKIVTQNTYFSILKHGRGYYIFEYIVDSEINTNINVRNKVQQNSCTKIKNKIKKIL